MPWEKSEYKKDLRSSPALSMKEAVSNLLKEYHLDDKMKEKQLILSWGEIMGKSVASRTSKVYIKDRTLVVHITSAPLRQELSMAKDKVIQLLEEEAGPGIVKDILFH